MPMYFLCWLIVIIVGRGALYVCCGWCMPDGAFFERRHCKHFKLFGRIDYFLLTRPALVFVPRRVWGLVEVYFLYVIFG